MENIAENLTECQKNAEEKTDNLEKITSKWVDIETNVKQIKTWTNELAPSSIQVINSTTLSPEERAKTTQNLKDQLTSHISTVDKLNDEVDSLIGICFI